MSILIKTVRIAGFRGLKNIEVELEQTTILTGMNNTGKTSLLMALQLALGNRQFISQDDFFIQGSTVSEKIIIDLLIVPISSDGKRCEDFLEDWEILYTIDRIRNDDTGNAFAASESYDFENLRESIGYGFRWYSPVGPLRLENGYVLDPEPGEKKSRWNFR